MSSFWLDLRLAARTLRRSHGYAALCIAALALGIGANGAIFSLVEALMLRPLPFPSPDRLVLAYMSVSGGRAAAGGAPEHLPWSYPKLVTMMREQRVFTQVAGFGDDSANLIGGNDPERLQIEYVSPSYFGELGVRPVLGRTLARDARPSDAVEVVIGEGLWRRRFGGDPAIVGRTLRLEKVPVTVVGVVPQGFRGLTGDAELWVPLTASPALTYPEILDEAQNHWLQVVARLRPGVTAAQLDAEMRRLGTLAAAAYPMPADADDGSTWSAGAEPLAQARRDPFARRALLVLLSAVAIVLLIACANLASLALVRASRRRRDLAIRRAVGASAWRLVRLSLFESLLLAGSGLLLGLLVAGFLVRALTAMRPEALGGWGIASTELHDLTLAGIDGTVIAFCAVAALLSAVLAGIGPALQAARVYPAISLRGSGGTVAGFRQRWAAGGGRPTLVAAQVALATVTLIGAGLLLRSLWSLQHVSLGVAPERVLAFSLSPSSGTYRAQSAATMHAQLLERLSALPGVVDVAVGGCTPASGEAGCNGTIVLSADGVPIPRASAPRIGWHKVSPTYFRTLGIPVLAGRPFDGRDRDGVQRTVILNQTAARRLFPRGDAVGHRVQIGTMGLSGEGYAEVVGVVGDVRYRRLEDQPGLEAYLPDAQMALASTTVFLRASGDPLQLVPTVRAAVREIDPTLPLYRVRTLEEQLGFAVSKQRFGSLLLLAFALLALLLAALGVYGVLAQAVSARRREIGLRIALGAATGQVEGMVLRQGMSLVIAGALLGLALSLAVTGVLRSLLYAVDARDPAMFLLGPAVLLLVAALACLVPARRASRLDPRLVLQQD